MKKKKQNRIINEAIAFIYIMSNGTVSQKEGKNIIKKLWKVKFCNLHFVSGWHLFSEQKPTEGDNIEVYYDDKTIVNIDWQDYLLKDKEYKHMRFWRACR